jgi:hypothetical protein
MNNVNPIYFEINTKVKNMQPPSGKSLIYNIRLTFLGKPFGTDITAADTRLELRQHVNVNQ